MEETDNELVYIKKKLGRKVNVYIVKLVKKCQCKDREKRKEESAVITIHVKFSCWRRLRHSHYKEKTVKGEKNTYCQSAAITLHCTVAVVTKGRDRRKEEKISIKRS